MGETVNPLDGSVSAAQTRAQAAASRVEVALRASGVGLWSWDIQNDEVEWDERMLKIFGVDATPTDVETYQKLLHPDDRERVMAHVSAALESGAYPDIVHRVLWPNGEVRWVHGQASVIKDAEGKPVTLLGAMMDITDRRRLEEQVAQNHKIEAIAQLTAGVAHNFNNMLMAMLPNIELVLPMVGTEEAEMLEDALTAGHQAAQMVKQLMTFAGRQPTEPPLHRAAAEVLERSLVGIRPGLPADVEIEIEPAPEGLTCEVRSDQVEQALCNIVANGVDAIRRRQATQAGPGRIHIASSKVTRPHPEAGGHARAWVRFVVQDDGIGMDRETRERAVEPFFTTKDVGLGVGLGLTTAYALAREHGGWISLESEVGVGTTTSLFIPAGPDSAERSEQAARQPMPEGPKGRRVLVVDDEPAVRRVVSRLLNGADFDVVVSGDGRSAVETAAKDPEIALVLLDVAMPDMSGREVLEELRRVRPDVRVVYFTGDAREVGSVAEADALLRKPVSRDALVDMVHRMLDTGA